MHLQKHFWQVAYCMVKMVSFYTLEQSINLTLLGVNSKLNKLQSNYLLDVCSALKSIGMNFHNLVVSCK